jgi:ribosomal protein S18 acetylase RimI-like enzyme
VELEQIAVHPDFQKKGIGTLLITESLPEVASKIAERGAVLKHIIVNTRSDNYAQKLYQKTLGAEVVAKVSGIFTADEVYMVAKNVQIPVRDKH